MPSFPKGPTRKTISARERRAEVAVIKRVRAACVERDGYCRLYRAGLGNCIGPSEWAHLPSHRRSKTRGQAPETRHTTEGSVMLCTRHHDALDARRFPKIEIEVGERGANGPIVARWVTEEARV